MVAMVLGLLLIGGSITIFSGNVRSSELSHAITHLQANARFALDELSADVRAAGFQGCTGAEDSILTLSTTLAPAGTLRTDALRAAEIRASGWVPRGPAAYVAPAGAGQPVVGTQALMVQYALAPGHTLDTSMSSRRSGMTIQMTRNDLFADGLAIVANCKSVDVFEIASVTGSGPRRTVTATDALSHTYVVSPDFPDSTRIYPLVSRVYYIGDTGRTNDNGDLIRSLYRHDLPYDGATHPPVELVEGVDQLQISFGLQQNGAMRFVDASASASVDVTLVQIGLLMTSHQRFAETDSGRIYTIAGRQVAPASAAPTTGVPQYPADARIRLPFSMTIKVRNRGLPGN